MQETASASIVSEHALPEYPTHRHAIPKGTLRVGRYMLRFASSTDSTVIPVSSPASVSFGVT